LPAAGTRVEARVSSPEPAGGVSVTPEPVKPVPDRRATTPVELHDPCTRGDGPDRAPSVTRSGSSRFGGGTRTGPRAATAPVKAPAAATTARAAGRRASFAAGSHADTGLSSSPDSPEPRERRDRGHGPSDRVRMHARVATGQKVARRRPEGWREPLTGRTAVVVDDGIATGSTARAACQVARAHGCL
jgi:hypothetical protein